MLVFAVGCLVALLCLSAGLVSVLYLDLYQMEKADGEPQAEQHGQRAGLASRFMNDSEVLNLRRQHLQQTQVTPRTLNHS